MSRSDLITLYEGSRHWHLAVRVAARLIVDGGRTRGIKARRIATALGWSGEPRKRPSGENRGTVAGEAVSKVVRVLVAEGLVCREGDDIVAVSVGEVADWLADELEGHKDLPLSERAGSEVREP